MVLRVDYSDKCLTLYRFGLFVIQCLGPFLVQSLFKHSAGV